MTRHALIVMGAAGAGKSCIGSALAAALGATFVEGDAFHPPDNILRMSNGIPLNDEDRRGWLLALAQELRAARDASQSVVLSCSALKRRYRDILRSGDEGIGFVFLTAEADVLRARLASRPGHFMPPSLIDSQLDALEPPQADERAWTFDACRTPDEIVAALLRALQEPPEA